MRICGVVSEYNPFHNGHKYLLDQIRGSLGDDTLIISVMSGNFVQRGEAAVFEKHLRAKCAVVSGADVVFELPLPWSSASAEYFARAAVSILAATGVVTDIAFGSECGDLACLETTAEVLLNPEIDELIREKLSSGISYAQARQQAFSVLSGANAMTLSAPNDILATEYIKAIRNMGLPIQPHAFQRKGAGHDSPLESEFASGSFLRNKLYSEMEIAQWIPEKTLPIIESEGEMVNRELSDIAILSRLRLLTESDVSSLPDVSEGLEKRFLRGIKNASTIEELVDSVSTKRYTEARIRRLTVFAALGIKANDLDGLPPYLMLLAANEKGVELLHRLKMKATIPVITKPASVKKLGIREQRIFSISSRATDLMMLGMKTSSSRTGEKEWKTSPVILK